MGPTIVSGRSRLPPEPCSVSAAGVCSDVLLKTASWYERLRIHSTRPGDVGAWRPREPLHIPNQVKVREALAALCALGARYVPSQFEQEQADADRELRARGKM